MKSKSRIIAVHLLNDLSGSPGVFRQAIEVLVQHHHEVQLFTASTAQPGFLTNIQGVYYRRIPYLRYQNRIFTLLSFLFSQAYLFVRLLLFLRRSDTVYINSMLPFGAAIAAKIRRCKTIYHIHEVSITPEKLKQFLLHVINQCADQCIFVSNYLQHQTPTSTSPIVVHNAVPDSFTQHTLHPLPNKQFTVLMLCSLKKYKGVNEFVNLAWLLPDMNFTLVLNETKYNIQKHFEGSTMPPNLDVFSATSNVHSFYRRASVVVNLSRTDEWVETFGMTILEGMAYGLPVIAPTVGGVTELVKHHQEGFLIESRNTQQLVQRLQELKNNQHLYQTMAAAASARASTFSAANFESGLLNAFDQLHSTYQLSTQS